MGKALVFSCVLAISQLSLIFVYVAISYHLFNKKPRRGYHERREGFANKTLMVLMGWPAWDATKLILVLLEKIFQQ